MQQKDDLDFAELLNRLTVRAKFSDHERALLTQTEMRHCPLYALCIFTIKKEASQHTAKTVSALYSDMCTKAHDYERRPL